MFTEAQIANSGIKRDSVITLTCKNVYETNVYSGVVAHVDNKHIGFQYATRCSQHNTSPQLMEFFSIGIQYIDELVVIKE